MVDTGTTATLRQLAAVGYALVGGFVFVRSPVGALALWTGAALMVPRVHEGLEARRGRPVEPWRLFGVASALAAVGVAVWLLGWASGK